MDDDRINALITAVNESLRGINDPTSCKVPDEVYRIEGLSGKKFKRFLNALLSKNIVQNYLEIGVWKGSTSVFGLYGNESKINHWVIDNFVGFKFVGSGQTLKDQFIRNWNSHLKVQPNLIENDCFEINPLNHGIGEVDVYFYDGEHEVEDHKKALTHYKNSMKDSFIYIVDDWNWEKVKTGTLQGISESNLTVVSKYEFIGTYADGRISGEPPQEGWWNGCGIFVFSK